MEVGGEGPNCCLCQVQCLYEVQCLPLENQVQQLALHDSPLQAPLHWATPRAPPACARR